MKVIRSFTGETSLSILLFNKYNLGVILLFQIPDYLMSTDATQPYWAIAAYVMTAFTVILFFVIIAMGNSMNVSLSILKQASTALGSIPSLLLYLSSHSLIARVPLLVAIVSLALFLFFGVSLGLAFSSSLSVSDYTNEIIGTIGAYIRRNPSNK